MNEHCLFYAKFSLKLGTFRGPVPPTSIWNPSRLSQVNIEFPFNSFSYLPAAMNDIVEITFPI